MQSCRRYSNLLPLCFTLQMLKSMRSWNGRLPELGLLNAGSGRLPDALLGLPALGNASSRPEAVSTGAAPATLAAPVPRMPPPPQYGVVVETGRGEERRIKPDAPLPGGPLSASSPRLAPVIEVTNRQASLLVAARAAAVFCCGFP